MIARKDKLFGDLMQVKIWRFKDQLPFQKHTSKLHQEQFPNYVKTWTNNHDIKILHSGFSTVEKILEKFKLLSLS
mgnify:CR=1 FL=1